MNTKDCISFKVRRLDRLLARQYDFALASASLKSTQFALLCNIARYGPIGLGELAKKIVIEPSTLTRNLQILIDAGWVKQIADKDARSRLVSITSKGVKKQQEARLLWETQQQHVIDLLGNARALAMSALLDEVMELLQKESER